MYRFRKWQLPTSLALLALGLATLLLFAVYSDRGELAPKSGINLPKPVSYVKHPCVRLEILVEKDCDLYERALRALESAPLAYNRPSRMIRGASVEVSLAIDTTREHNPEIQVKGVKGDIAKGSTQIVQNMSAELRGRAFEITPSGLQNKIATGAAPVQWTWYVTPNEAGENQLLVLNIFARIGDVDGFSDPIPIKTFRDQIFVDVNKWTALLVGGIWILLIWYANRRNIVNGMLQNGCRQLIQSIGGGT